MDSRALLPRDAAVQLIDADGATVADEQFALPDQAALLRAYRGLVQARRINDQASALVRQGRLAVYPSSHGQEACQIGAALALADGDWLFPTYRDSVAVIARGVSPWLAVRSGTCPQSRQRDVASTYADRDTRTISAGS